VSQKYTVTFQGARNGRQYSSYTDDVGGTRFPVGEPVKNVSQAAVDRLASITRLDFKIVEQTPQKES
jgi:hypothetical protein